MRSLAAILLIAALAALAACGGSDEPETTAAEEETTTTADAGVCSEVEEVEVLAFGQHEGREFVAADYETNPPSGGDHNDTPLESGSFYTEADTPLGEAVHLLEHGAVIGWTNGLDSEEQSAIEEAFNEVFQEGYYQLATVENPELEVPFALSAWGAVQTCESASPEAVRPFVEEWYASPKSGESGLACDGTARRLPPC
jgi:hypothetical protein